MKNLLAVLALISLVTFTIPALTKEIVNFEMDAKYNSAIAAGQSASVVIAAETSSSINMLLPQDGWQYYTGEMIMIYFINPAYGEKYEVKLVKDEGDDSYDLGTIIGKSGNSHREMIQIPERLKSGNYMVSLSQSTDSGRECVTPCSKGYSGVIGITGIAVSDQPSEPAPTAQELIINTVASSSPPVLPRDQEPPNVPITSAYQVATQADKQDEATSVFRPKKNEKLIAGEKYNVKWTRNNGQEKVIIPLEASAGAYVLEIRTRGKTKTDYSSISHTFKIAEPKAKKEKKADKVSTKIRDDNYGVVRFTAPSSGTFSVTADFAPVVRGDEAKGASLTVLANNKKVYWREMGKSEERTYEKDFVLLEGEYVDFQVGRGRAGESSGSGLKMSIKISGVSNDGYVRNYDLSKEFPSIENPKGVWSVGYKSSTFGKFDVFKDGSKVTDDDGLSVYSWSPRDAKQPSAYWNSGSKPARFYEGKGVFSEGTVWVVLGY